MFIDYLAQYRQIQSLASETDSQLRGYRFEQLIRETLPWSHRPPISAIGKSEQHDAYFVWEGRDYLVESKAKRGQILRGSHDWEDFELKIRKRQGQVCGIFASLYEVSTELFEATNDLSMQGMYVAIIDADIWNILAETQVGIDRYIEYVFRSLKLTNKFTPSSTKNIKEYFEDKNHSRSALLHKLRPISAQFLRRHKMDLHEKTYVARSSDEMIRQRCMMFRPSNLNATKTRRKNDGSSFSAHRLPERQIVLLRDVSGAGKTTFAVQMALNQTKEIISICRAASDPFIDRIQEELTTMGPDYGLDHLITIDGTLLYVVDSLDEAEYLSSTRKAVISLNKSLSILNEYATTKSLAKFPIVIVYTLREEHWRNWESVFEGADIQYHQNRFSFFDNSELRQAIQNYSDAYGYNFTRNMTEDEAEALRSPFDLFVFSETFSHEGAIDPAVIFSQSVLSNYFRRKEESIALRPIPGISAERVMGLIALLATRLTSSGSFDFWRYEAYDVFKTELDIAPENYDRVVNICLSENILVRSEKSTYQLRFRHSRFIEYLFVVYFVGKLRSGNISGVIDFMIENAKNNPIISVVSACDLFRKISEERYPERFDEILSHFSQSVPLLKRIAQKNRLESARGRASESGDLEMLRKGLATGDPELIWETYFVFMSKKNNTTIDLFRQIFVHCWNLNAESGALRKMIGRLDSVAHLTDEVVAQKVVSSRRADVWLTYVDRFVAVGALADFREICRELDFVATASRLSKEEPNSEWRHVDWVLGYTKHGEPYPLGVGESLR